MTELTVPQLYSEQAEQAVIGGVLLDATAWDRVDLDADEFFCRRHAIIWRALTALHRDGEPTDAVTVADWLEAQGQLADVDGLAYIGSLAEDTPSAANIAAYAKIVRDFADRRALFSVSTQVGEMAHDRSRPTAELIGAAQGAVLALGDHKPGGPVALRECIGEFLDRLKQRIESPNGMVGHPTGHNDIDGFMHGVEDGDLVIVAGRPSMGKSILGFQWCEHIAAHVGPAAFFSLEMRRAQLVQRAVSRLARVSHDALRSGQLPDQDQWRRVNEAIIRLRDIPLHIDDTAGLSVADVRARARALHQRHGLKAVFVDYLTLMRADEKHDRRDLEVTALAEGLKACAKELGIPVVCLAQLNRDVEKRPDKRPVMADLRDSGGIEQAADVIAFIYRDEVYDEDSPHKGIAEIIFRKQRNGPTGTVRLSFLGDLQAFENLAPDDYERAMRPPMRESRTRGAPAFDRAAGEA